MAFPGKAGVLGSYEPAHSPQHPILLPTPHSVVSLRWGMRTSRETSCTHPPGGCLPSLGPETPWRQLGQGAVEPSGGSWRPGAALQPDPSTRGWASAPRRLTCSVFLYRFGTK